MSLSVSRENCLDVVLLLTNVFSTVFIVLVNKEVLKEFPYVMSLTFIHQLIGGILLAARSCSFRSTKSMPLWANTWWSVLDILGIYFANQSLRLNTVTLYQVLKLLNIPVQCLWQCMSQNKVSSGYVYLTLVVLTVGVGITTIAELDLQASPFGIAAGLLSIIVVVLDQAECKRLRDKFEVGAVDFLMSTLIHRLVVCGAVIVTTEFQAVERLQQLPWVAVGLLVLSCVFATSLNLTAVVIVGKFGPVTNSVVGHAKTVIIVVLGFVLRAPPFNLIFAKQCAGIFTSMIGAIKYGQYTAFPDSDWCAACHQASEKDLEASVSKFSGTLNFSRICVGVLLSSFLVLWASGSLSMPWELLSQVRFLSQS